MVVIGSKMKPNLLIILIIIFNPAMGFVKKLGWKKLRESVCRTVMDSWNWEDNRVNIRKEPCVAYSNYHIVEGLVVWLRGFVKIARFLSTMKQKNGKSKKIHSAQIPNLHFKSSVTHQDFYGARVNAADLAASIISVSELTIMVSHMSDVPLKHHSHEP